MFTTPILYKEYPNYLGNGPKGSVPQYPFRLYYSVQKYTDGTKYRWHFGWPKALVAPMCPILESGPYWGEQHWHEDGDFWLWWIMYMSDRPEPDFKKLESHFQFAMRQYNSCLNTFRKWASNSKATK